MKVIQLPDVLHDYLVHVVEKHAASGIHPEEGVALHRLWEAVTKHVQHFDDQQVRAAAASASPLGQSPVAPETDTPGAQFLPGDHKISGDDLEGGARG